MNIFKGQNLLEFTGWLKTDKDCKGYFTDIKWKDGFQCVECMHKKAQIKKRFFRHL